MTLRKKRQLAIIVWAVAAIYAVMLFRELPWHVGGHYRDFSTYYPPAALLRHGVNPYLVYNRWGDTPSWFLCFEPLTLLAPFTAYKVWFLVNVGALAGALILLLRDCGLEPAEQWLLAGLMVIYPPIALNFWFAQSEVFLLFLLVLFIHELQRGRDLTAGLTLAGASLLRAYPAGLLGYLVARRKWRAIVYTLVGGAAGMAGTVAAVGVGVVAAYARNVLSPNALNQPIGLLRHPSNLSLGWFVRFVMLHGFGVAERSTLSAGFALAAELSAVAFAFVATRRLSDDSDWRGFSLWIFTISIISPIMWAQFMVCFVIVFVALAKARAGRPAVIAAAVSYAVLTVLGGLHGYPFNQLTDLLRVHFAGTRMLHFLPETVTFSLASLYLACFWFIREPVRCESRHTETGTPRASATAAP